MCGIFGFIIKENSDSKSLDLKRISDGLFKLIESRGKEGSGVSIAYNNKIYVYKEPILASRFIKMKAYQELFTKLKPQASNSAITIAGHARLVTHGDKQDIENYQPVVKNGLICFHNGIVVNEKELWGKFPEFNKKFGVDTEIINDLFSHFLKQGNNLYESIKQVFENIEGANSIILLSGYFDNVVLATTNGSLYLWVDKEGEVVLFASEKYIVEKFLLESKLGNKNDPSNIIRIYPNTGYLIDVKILNVKKFDLKGITDKDIPTNKANREINLISAELFYAGASSKVDKSSAKLNPGGTILINYEKINKLRRCKKCLLPETFPFIKFAADGVCNYCSSYKGLSFIGLQALKEVTEKYKKQNNGPDCIVALSGGRDSCYGLHYVTTKLGLNPIAYTYDWGMVTDLARRNISRICGKLGIEHVIIAADIDKKRSYIRKNVLAWLKKPDLGLVPLFMAGDKYYFYFANQLMKKYKNNLFIMSENRLERTHFKHGFCGVNYSENNETAYNMTISDKAKLIMYYLKGLFLNTAYINSSLLDSIGGYIAYYLLSHNYLYLYNYIPWDEKEVIETLRKEYDWEVAEDGKTWRIGDGTAAFYNYIYYRIAGFTENDTFRSNQIREGMLKRDEALQCVNAENIPRADSIKWYLDSLGLDYEMVINKVNKIKPLYEK